MMGYQRLSQVERYQISALVRSGVSIRQVARSINRDPSTVCRELRRNAHPKKGYKPELAQRAANKRRSRIHPPIRIKGDIRFKIHNLLSIQWSPEQIAGTLRFEGTTISSETIYKYIYENSRRSGSLYKNLRRSRRARRSLETSRAYKNRGKILKYTLIWERPPEVEARDRLGNYERDTIVGRGKSSLLTIVDRTSRRTKMKKVKRMSASLTHHATVDLLKNLPKKSITNDQGSEFSEFEETEKQLGIKVYFNEPHSPWQRGTNENTNGLIRQYFPKGTNFDLISDEEIARVEDLLNNRPRKILGFKTPNEVQRVKSEALH